MVDRTYSPKGRQLVQVYVALILDAEMSIGDTVTVGECTLSKNLAQAFIVNKADGTLLTSSISNNVVTMTNAGLNLRVTIFVFGEPV